MVRIFFTHPELSIQCLRGPGQDLSWYHLSFLIGHQKVAIVSLVMMATLATSVYGDETSWGTKPT